MGGWEALEGGSIGGWEAWEGGSMGGRGWGGSTRGAWEACGAGVEHGGRAGLGRTTGRAWLDGGRGLEWVEPWVSCIKSSKFANSSVGHAEEPD